jgi:hypothetical protein
MLQLGTTALEKEEEELNLRLSTNFSSGSYTGKINLSISSCPISFSYFLILPSHIRLGLQIDLFLSDFLTKILYEFHFSGFGATYPTHIIVFDLKAVNIYCCY